MKPQFGKEYLNRQDKARKPDYRGEMIERGRSAPSDVLERLNDKIEAKRDLIRHIRKRKFSYRGHVLKLGWPLEHFAKVNSLITSEAATKEAYLAFRAAIERDMEKVTAAIMKKGTVKFQRLFGKLRVPYVEWECPDVECE